MPAHRLPLQGLLPQQKQDRPGSSRAAPGSEGLQSQRAPTRSQVLQLEPMRAPRVALRARPPRLPGLLQPRRLQWLWPRVLLCLASPAPRGR